MSKRTNILLGISIAAAYVLLFWLISRHMWFAVFNGICMLAGWFASDFIKWIRKRKTA